jgi:Rrf2 family nitric oxide-sensitive transcriptional repressor
MKLITRETDYSIRALTFLAQHEGKVISATQLVSELKVPRPFLRGLMQVLQREGFLISTRGKGGGFILKRRAQDIRVIDIIKVFQGSFSLLECFLNKSPCPNKIKCKFRKEVMAIEDFARKRFSAVTIASFL